MKEDFYSIDSFKTSHQLLHIENSNLIVIITLHRDL